MLPRRAAGRRAALPAALLLAAVTLAALAGLAEAQRGDRYANSGQGTQRATDKCTFTYKVRRPAFAAPPLARTRRPGPAGRLGAGGATRATAACALGAARSPLCRNSGQPARHPQQLRRLRSGATRGWRLTLLPAPAGRRRRSRTTRTA